MSSGREFDSRQLHQKHIMKYKIVVKTNYSTYVKKRSRNKEHLVEIALMMSKKHPTWKIFVVGEDTII